MSVLSSDTMNSSNNSISISSSSVQSSVSLEQLFSRVHKSDILSHFRRLIQSDNVTNHQFVPQETFMAVARDAIDYIREISAISGWDKTKQHYPNVYIQITSSGKATLVSRTVENSAASSKLDDVFYALLTPTTEETADATEDSQILCVGMWEWNQWLGRQVDRANYSQEYAVAACLYVMLNLGTDYRVQMRIFDGKIKRLSLRDQILQNGQYSCNGCGSILVPPVNGQWRCQHCNDYDLCGMCYTNGRANHASDHVFARLSTFEEQALVDNAMPADGQAA